MRNFFAVAAYFLFPAMAYAQEVNIKGAMRNVMWKGELAGIIHLDTINPKNNLYGLGPVEFLQGEIMIADGKFYVSTVGENGEALLGETAAVKAPFFVYAHVKKWKELEVPGFAGSLKQIEQYLHDQYGNLNKPFPFKITGAIDTALIHIMNLPTDATVASPADAHKARVYYNVYDETVEIVGFFSTGHQSVFTHHDSFVHMHLLAGQKQTMGHVDELKMKKGKWKLFVPAEL